MVNNIYLQNNMHKFLGIMRSEQVNNEYEWIKGGKMQKKTGGNVNKSERRPKPFALKSNHITAMQNNIISAI